MSCPAKARGSVAKKIAMATNSFTLCVGRRSPVLLCLLFFCSLIFSSPCSGVQASRPSPQENTSRMLLAFADFGNMSLPDPDVINAFLRTNTTLSNILLPGAPPLQLIKCHVYLMPTGTLFNFYTADHPRGCEEAPSTAVKPLSAYSASERFWSFELRKSWIFSWPLLLALVFVHFFVLSQTPDDYERRTEDLTTQILCGVAWVLFIGSLCGALFLAFKWTAAQELHPQLLPAPATNLNPFLHASGISLNLHSCNANSSLSGRDLTLFQFYTGMPQSFCSQLLAAKAIYGDYLDNPPNGVGFWYEGGPLYFLLPVRGALLTAAIFCWALLLVDVPCSIAFAFRQRSSVSEGENERILGQKSDRDVEGSLKDSKQGKVSSLSEAV